MRKLTNRKKHKSESYERTTYKHTDTQYTYFQNHLQILLTENAGI